MDGMDAGDLAEQVEKTDPDVKSKAQPVLADEEM